MEDIESSGILLRVPEKMEKVKLRIVQFEGDVPQLTFLILFSLRRRNVVRRSDWLPRGP